MITILFPTDFSENSSNAAQYAAILAKRFDAKLIIFNVFSNMISLGTEAQMLNNHILMESHLEKIALQNLESFKNEFLMKSELQEIQIELKVVYGFVPEAILEYAKAENASMIVMSTKGKTNALEKLFGSNTESVIKSSDCPVWIIPQDTPIQLPQTFLYASDLEENESLAVQTLLDFAKPLGASCKVIHIKEFFDPETEQKTNAILKDLKNEFEKEKIIFKNLVRSNIINGIETYSGNSNPDVLVLGVYEKSFFSNFFNESITKHFIGEGLIPLLIFKKELHDDQEKTE